MSDDGRALIPGRRVADWAAEFLAKVGFPIAVATFLLLSLGMKVDTMSGKLDRIIQILEIRK